MKDRRLRRFLTRKYKRKQERLYNSHYRPHETSPSYDTWEAPDNIRGHWCDRSWKDFGPCQCCCNPRHSVLYNKKDKVTIQEKRSYDSFFDQLEEIS